MPTVPKQSNQTVLPSRGPIVFQSDAGAASLGNQAVARNVGRAAEALGRTADDTAKLALKLQAEDNERDTKLADNSFSEAIRRINYGDTEQGGFYSTSGMTTLEAAPAAQEEINKARREISASIQNPAVRRKFEEAAAARIEREFSSMTRFTARQRVVANRTAAEARMNAAIEDGVAYNNDQVLNRSAGIIFTENEDLAEQLGWSPEVREAKLKEAFTALYSNSIKTALRQDDVQAAQAILDKRGARMDDVIRSEMEGLINDAGLRANAQTEADAIMGATVTEREALARAREIDDAKLRDETVKRVEARWADKRRFEKEEERAFTRDLFDSIYAGDDIDAWAQANPEAWARLPDTTIARAERTQLRRKKGETYAQVSDAKTMTELMQLETAELAQIDLREYQNTLTESEFKRVQNAIKAANNKIKGAQAKSAKFYRAGERAIDLNAPESLRIGLSKQTDDQRRAELVLRHEMDAWIEGELDAGNEPTIAEMNRQAQLLTTEVESDPKGFMNSVTGMVAEIRNMTPQQRAVVRMDFENIPASLGDSIKETATQPPWSIATDKLTEDVMEELAGAFAADDRARVQRILESLQ